MSNFLRIPTVVMLLLLQAWLGVGRGRVMCLSVHTFGICAVGVPPLGVADESESGIRTQSPHADSPEVGCKGECDHHSDAPVAPPHPEHPVGHLEQANPCDCCIHVPTPDPEQLPQARADNIPALREVPIAICIAELLTPASALHAESPRCLAPPDRVRAIQTLSLRATQIMI